MHFSLGLGLALSVKLGCNISDNLRTNQKLYCYFLPWCYMHAWFGFTCGYHDL